VESSTLSSSSSPSLSSSSSSSEKTSLVTTLSMSRQEQWQKYLAGSSNGNSNRDDVLRSLGRVLVWLMTPIAAEVLKYGKVLVADPQRPRKVLQVLADVSIAKSKRVSTTDTIATSTPNNVSDNNLIDGSSSGNSNPTPLAKTLSTMDVSSVVPVTVEDQEAILQWAYYEAELLLKQYGDVLEGLNDYITVGTSNVAECVEFLESELS